MTSGSMNKRLCIKEIVEQHHLEMYFQTKTHVTSTCRLGENAKEYWGHRLDTKTHATAVEVWINKYGNKTFPWKTIAQWHPLEQPHGNRGRRFENRRRNVGVIIGKCECGAIAIHQHIVTGCLEQSKREVTEEAKEESKKHITQSRMPEAVKEVMRHMNEYTWDSIEMEKEGRELGEQHWDETQQQIARAM
jgi:hypothetical protein